MQITKRVFGLSFADNLRLMIKEFTDALGTHWLVWATIPVPSGGVVGTMRDGWLTFESDAVRRRLVPIPAGWEDASPAKLDLMCRAAARVRRTPSGFQRFEIIDAEDETEASRSD